uniref:Uncharacterized protein n=1 Tax=uncultured organism TaxID=155900 RepID=A0A385FV55_9ZZZZ|nr:hypothetical protein TRI11_00014 [uncultured organism]AXV45683.1 hypothetical protein TRI7_00034 [uncultured organism]
MKLDECIDKGGIREGAVAGEPDNLAGAKGLRRQMKALQHVVQGAAKTGNIQLCAERRYGEIIGLVTGGDHQLIQSGRALEPFNLAGEHGGAEQGLEHLARQPAGAGSGLQDTEDHDELQSAGLMRAGSSQARAASASSWQGCRWA